MSSTFATATGKRNTPSWCKAGMFGGIDPTVNGRPTSLSAYGRWTGDFYGDLYNVIETFHLPRNPTNDGWAGESAPTGKRIRIECADSALLTIVSVTLILLDDDAIVDSFTWHNVSTTKRPPWGTEQLFQQMPPHAQLIEVQLLA